MNLIKIAPKSICPATQPGREGPPVCAVAGAISSLFSLSNEFQQAGKMFAQLRAAQRRHALGALHLGENNSCRPEHFKMMRTCRLGNIEPDFVARQLPSLRGKQFADNRHPAGVGQRLHHRVQRDIAQGRMGVLFHDNPRCHQNDSSTMVELLLTGVKTGSRFDGYRTKAGIEIGFDKLFI